MSNFVRSILLCISILAGVTYGSTSVAQPTEGKSAVLVHMKVDGIFAHYLESINGDIDGVALDDGTLARFALFSLAPQPITLRPGDTVRIEGDMMNGLVGPYLVHALVTRINVPMTRREALARPALGATGNGSQVRRVGKEAFKDSAQPVRATGKLRSPLKVKTGRDNDILTVDNARVHTRKNGSLEIIESKAREATTGKGGNNLQWSRVEETAGP